MALSKSPSATRAAPDYSHDYVDWIKARNVLTVRPEALVLAKTYQYIPKMSSQTAKTSSTAATKGRNKKSKQIPSSTKIGVEKHIHSASGTMQSQWRGVVSRGATGETAENDTGKAREFTTAVIPGLDNGEDGAKSECLSCRKDKAKCDGNRPNCGRCRTKGFLCIYDTKQAHVTDHQSVKRPLEQQSDNLSVSKKRRTKNVK